MIFKHKRLKNSSSKIKTSVNYQKGSMMLLTFFVFLVVSLITLSLWKLIELRIKLSLNQEQYLRAKFAARSGIEDAIMEIKAENDWAEDNDALHSEWVFVADDTFYKSNSATDSLTFFDYPVTFSVTVTDGDEDYTYDIISNASVKYNEESDKIYYSTYQATVLKSFNGEIMVLDLIEI